jgi:hypothetical protein
VTRSRSRDSSAGKAVLDSLQARELSLRKAKVERERVKIVQFRVNKRSSNSFGSGIIEEMQFVPIIIWCSTYSAVS